MVRKFGGAVSLAILLAAFSADAGAQAGQYVVHRETIRGKITADSGRAVRGATVTVTMAPDRTYLQAKTDSTGAYAITFELGTGDYLVHVAAQGMVTERKRVLRSGEDSILVVNVSLQSEAPTQLATVRVRAQKPKPRRGSEFGRDLEPGAAEEVANGVAGAVAPDAAGNLSALAATVPGVALTGEGPSVLGMSPAANQATLNGLSFGGADIPRAALTQARVSSSTYDPARGWFGGFQEQVEMASDVVGSIRSGYLTLDAPALQYTDPVGRALGSRFTAARLGVGGADRFHRDDLEYNYGISADRRTDTPASLLTASPLVLQPAGVASDSVARIRALLPSLGLAGSALADLPQTTDHLSFVGQVGKAPSNWATFQPAKATWTLLGFGSLTRQDAMGLRPRATGTSRFSSHDGSGGVQLHVSDFVRDNALLEARTGVSMDRQATRPTVLLPAGTVSLLSDLGADGGVSAALIAIGGAANMYATTTRWTWETAADLRAFPLAHSTHRLKLSGDVRVDGVRDETGPDLGTFTFRSLDELATGTATSFTRTLNAPVQSARAANGFVALGDWWRASDNLQLVYGVRAEATRFLDAPPANSAVQSAFGYATDHVPNAVGLSPRLGFTWHHRAADGSTYSGPLGEIYGLPSGTLRGGIGDFRSFQSPALITGARTATGLPTGELTLACAGAAVPAVDWSAYAADPGAIPEDCVGGASPLAATVPSVQLFDPSYRTPHSIRGNLGYTSRISRFTYTVDAVYSLNLDQPGRVDLNFADQPTFTSPEGRSIYAPASDIVPSGVIAPGAAARLSAYGHVFDNVSSNRSVAKQVTLTLMPDLDAVGRWYASGSYTLASARMLANGFDGSTFGSPLGREWSRSDLDVRHQFVLEGGVAANHVAFTLFGHIQSGLPFTPLVGSDVNGDGLVNDRAFVFSPATAPDSAVRAGMQSLLASAPKSVARCLTHQFGSAAGRNSCDGPWTAMLNAQVAYHGALPFVHRSGVVTLFFNNPLGGLDQLVHGPDHLHGWGSFALPDPMLYSVRGFDPAMHQFQYVVNSRFGDARPSAMTFRTPFRVTLDVSVNLSADSYVQFLHRLVRPGRNGFAGPKFSAAMTKRWYERTIPDPYQAILEESDSLLLSRAQVDSLHAVQRTYLAERDSILNGLANYLAGLGDTYDESEALHRQREAVNAAAEVGHVSIRHILPSILDKLQLRMLPYPANRLLAAPDNVHGMDAMQAP